VRDQISFPHLDCILHFLEKDRFWNTLSCMYIHKEHVLVVHVYVNACLYGKRPNDLKFGTYIESRQNMSFSAHNLSHTTQNTYT